MKHFTPSFRKAAVAAVLIFSQPASAIELPDLGEVSRATLSEASEDRIGREIMRQLRDSAEYLDDPVIREYLNDLGDRLAAASPDPARRFEFFPVRDASINAFALPGGYIGVHTGLISAARNESELAGVLAHEIAHVTQKHIARIVDGQKSAGLASLVALAVAILAARSNTDVAQAAIVTAQAMSVQNQLDFTREHEREADRIGLRTLTDAGFSPIGMATFFERLQTQSRLYENNAPAYLRTHPLNHERIADIQNRVADGPYRQHVDSVEFGFIRARVQAGEGEAADAVRLFEARVAEKPDAIAWYGLARASSRAGDHKRAARALATIDGEFAGSPLVAHLAIELALAEGRADDAARLSEAALARHGAYRPLGYLRARALLRAGQPRAALAFLSDRQRIWSADDKLFALQAEAHQAMGETARARLAQAEAHALNDRIGAAIEQLEMGQRVRDADFHTQSIIDARLRALREKQGKDAQNRERKDREGGR